MSNAAANESQLANIHDEAERVMSHPDLGAEPKAAVAEVLRVAELENPTDAESRDAVGGLISAYEWCNT